MQSNLKLYFSINNKRKYLVRLATNAKIGDDIKDNKRNSRMTFFVIILLSHTFRTLIVWVDSIFLHGFCEGVLTVDSFFTRVPEHIFYKVDSVDSWQYFFKKYSNIWVKITNPPNKIKNVANESKTIWTFFNQTEISPVAKKCLFLTHDEVLRLLTRDEAFIFARFNVTPKIEKSAVFKTSFNL